MTTRGLFLDLDGTLADSLSTLRGVYGDFLGEFGVRGSEREFERLNGPPLAEVVQSLRRAHNLPGTPEQLLDRYLGMVAAARANTRPVAGATEVLRRAKERGWYVAIVTSSHRSPTEAWLKRVDLLPLIDAVIGGDDVARGKPDPAPYCRALALAQCAAGACIAVEDSPQGALAAIRAGVPTYLIAPSVPAGLLGQPQLLGPISSLKDIIPAL